jgi:type IV secretory pathway TrbF-like protein
MSTKEFMKPVETYDAGDDRSIEYQKAEKKWDQRDGEVRHQNYNLRRLFLISVLSNMILAGGLWYQSAKSTVTPYVVEVESSGQVRAVGLAKEAVYEPKEAEVKYFMERFIQDARTIPMDPVVAKNQWSNAFALLGQTARSRMSEEFKKYDMYGRLGLETTQIAPKTIFQQSANTYQVRWTEEVFGKDGNLKERYNMAGSFTVEFKVPKTEKEVRINPLGLYITNFSWAKEL